jgi:hypothetical protein
MSSVKINGIACDPTAATRVYTSIAGDHCFVAESRRFDDPILAQQLFPDD